MKRRKEGKVGKAKGREEKGGGGNGGERKGRGRKGKEGMPSAHRTCC